MNSEEFLNGGNEDGGEEIVINSKGDPFVAQKDQEILELKQKISSLEAERDDLQSLVEEQASKMMSAIESGDESKRRAAETESRLEEASQQLAEANSSLKYLEEELRMLKSVAARAAELETQVVRLQHDLISVMNERDAILAELETMSASLEDTRKASDLKDSTIKSLEDERDSLRERVEGQDRTLDAFMKQLEETLSDANSKLAAEKRALDEGNKRLMVIEMQSKMQEEKIKGLETRLKQSEIEREVASQAYMEKEERHHELSVELKELGSQLEKSLNEKRLLEELSKEREVKVREEHQLVVGKSQSNEREIEALEKAVAELSAKLDSAEAERKELIEKLGCSGNGASKSLPSQEIASRIQWPMAAAASTGTLAAAAFMAYLKYSRRR